VLQGGPPVYTDDFVLADAVPQHSRRFTNYSGDVSGRYIGALAAASGQTDKLFPSLDRVVSKILKMQNPDGHFGDPFPASGITANEMAILWGNGRLLVGLLEHYGLDKRPEVLAAARRLGDFLLQVAPRLNHEEVRKEFNGERFAAGYICWTHNTEGLAELYRVTRDDRYLALARGIAARTDRHPSQHSHGFLTSLRGVLALYRATGEGRYLEQVETEWKSLAGSPNLLVQHAVPEMFAPQIKRDEGCSEADWLRLSLGLWRATRKPEYLEEAEATLFNEFVFNQFHTGDFGHVQLTPTGAGGIFARAWWCCTLHGLRALADLMDDVFRECENGLAYDLPVDGQRRTRGLALRADSSLEHDGTVRLEVVRAGRRPHTLAVRQPAWATGVSVSVDGHKVAGQMRNGYLELQRTWNEGETIVISYGFRTRAVRHPELPRQAIFYGPWLLAVDQAGSPNYFDEPFTSNQLMLKFAGEEAKLESARGVRNAERSFTIPVAAFRVAYLPGGYPMQPAHALLRPIAEHTSQPDGNVFEFWLPVPETADQRR
jgi:DUF1680 family protein